jgi:hypothetical protein
VLDQPALVPVLVVQAGPEQVQHRELLTQQQIPIRLHFGQLR